MALTAFKITAFFVALSVTVAPPHDPDKVVILTSRKHDVVIFQCAGEIPDILTSTWR